MCARPAVDAIAADPAGEGVEAAAPPCHRVVPHAPVDVVAGAGAAAHDVVAAVAADPVAIRAPADVVGAAPAFDEVVPPLAVDRVLAATAVDPVAPGAAADHVVAAGAEDDVRPAAAEDHVGAAAAVDRRGRSRRSSRAARRRTAAGPRARR